MLAEEQPNEFQNGGLSRTRTARENDAARYVSVAAVAGFHRLCE
jgi:hypothetical protein